jgi:hypothetical protein
MTVVGVTGHRILAEHGKLVESIRVALDRVRQLNPSAPLTILSALAEGADRLVAREALKPNEDRLVAVLPLARDDYARDFHSDKSRAEFHELLAEAADVIELPGNETREGAYEDVGNYVVDHSHALLAIWDGNSAQGRGGTANVVARARSSGLPVAWIKAGNCVPGSLNPTSLGADQGKLTFENFDR